MLQKNQGKTLFLLLFSPGLSTEGIYRVSGNKAEMESMQRQFDQGEFHSTPGCTTYCSHICTFHSFGWVS